MISTGDARTYTGAADGPKASRSVSRIMEVVLTDSERSRAARSLRERYANGALALPDLEAQLERVLSASTQEELDSLLHDDRSPQLPARMLGADIAESDLVHLETHLVPGERTYWIGHPDERSHLTPQDIVLLPVAGIWALVSGVLMFAVPWPLTLVLVVLFIGSLQFLVGRFLFPSRRRRRTFYAVTDRRVISVIRRRWLADDVKEMYLTAIPRVTVHRRRSSRGTVLFGDAPRYDELRFLEQTLNDEPMTGVGFYNIEDPETIKAVVESARG